MEWRFQRGIQSEERGQRGSGHPDRSPPRLGKQLDRRDARQRSRAVQCRPRLFDHGRHQNGRGKLPAKKDDAVGRKNRKGRRIMRTIFLISLCAASIAAVTPDTRRGRVDNTLTEAERRNGWILLFDGKTHAGWMNSDRTAPRTPVQERALNPHRAGHYMLVHTQEWENFIL